MPYAYSGRRTYTARPHLPCIPLPPLRLPTLPAAAALRRARTPRPAATRLPRARRAACLWFAAHAYRTTPPRAAPYALHGSLLLPPATSYHLPLPYLYLCLRISCNFMTTPHAVPARDLPGIVCRYDLLLLVLCGKGNATGELWFVGPAAPVSAGAYFPLPGTLRAYCLRYAILLWLWT